MQMKDKKGIDENKYDHLLMTSNLEGIVVSSVLENKPLILIDEEGKEL